MSQVSSEVGDATAAAQEAERAHSLPVMRGRERGIDPQKVSSPGVSSAEVVTTDRT